MNLETKILDYLFEHDGQTKEYSLLQYIEKQMPEFFNSLGKSPSLFKKHFYLFNCLYKIDESLSRKNLRLIISALDIRICQRVEAQTEVAETDALRAFYTDLNNLNLSDEEVLAMQTQFWQKYLALDKKAEALKILCLTEDDKIDRAKLKKQYKKLANLHHPDKGGDEAYFLQINEAFEQLKLIINQ